MSDRTRRPASGRQPGRPKAGQGSSQPKAGGAGRPPAKPPAPSSHSASGTPRAGRREAERRRPPQPATPTLIDRLRIPFLVSFVVFVVMAGAIAIVTQTAQPVYACSAIDTVQSPAPGELGQVQPDQGAQHVLAGDKVTYAVCPPASGKHLNAEGLGPIAAKVYGQNDQAVPNGWVHNLEHGGLVVLYSCDKGACDAASTSALQAFYSQFPASPICSLPPGAISPVVARFEQMPTEYAALVWDRVLYLNSLDVQAIDQFFLRYAERLSDGKFVAPPEPQCTAPSTGPSGSPASSTSAPSASSAATSPAPSASGG